MKCIATKVKVHNANRNGKIKVSVIMPVFNTKRKYLREALESVLHQTYKNFELVVIDNGSKEYVKKIITSYDDLRIRYLRLNRNKGPAEARNYGIEHSIGEYIAFLDSDDIAYPERLEQQVNFLDNHLEVGCLGSATEIIGNDAKKIKNIFPQKHTGITNYMIFIGCPFFQSSVMIRKSVLKKYNIKYRVNWFPVEDYGLYVDLLGKTNFYSLNTVLTKYRYYYANTSHKNIYNQKIISKEVQIYAFKKHCKFYCNNKELLFRFLFGKIGTKAELIELTSIIKELIEYLCDKGCSREMIMYAFGRKIRRIYYHTHSLKLQWYLMMSPLNEIFNFSFRWRLMCLITRGIL